jgi:hypothetical protein
MTEWDDTKMGGTGYMEVRVCLVAFDVAKFASDMTEWNKTWLSWLGRE